MAFMELRQLRHFLALAELGSFTAAAAREHIVQSGLSNSVHALERELGADLYVRSTRPVRLTTAGQALVEPARRALEAARAARTAVRDVQDVVTGQLRIGVIGSALRVVPFAGYVAEFAAAHPAVDVRLLQAPALAMVRMVGAGELDCGIVTAVPDTVAGVRLVTLANERLQLVCRDDHRLARAASPRLSDLAGERFVDVQPEWSARVMVDAAFVTAGVTRRVSCEVNEWELFLELVAAGLGIGFIPEGLALVAAASRASRLRVVPVQGLDLERHIQLALPGPGDLTPAARRFAEQVRQHHPQVPA
jgi:DNA-binding transcriptional LysR family regulator